MKDRAKMNRDHRALIQLLEDRKEKGATTTEMVEAGYNGYRGRITELRKWFGYEVICEYDGMTEEGRKKHRYYLGEYDTRPKKWRGFPPAIKGEAVDSVKAYPSDLKESPLFGQLHCKDHNRNYEPGSRCPKCVLGKAKV